MRSIKRTGRYESSAVEEIMVRKVLSKKEHHVVCV